MIDVTTGLQTATVSMPDGSSPFVAAVSANGRQLLVGGFGTAVTPDNNHLYLTEPSAGIVQIVNLKKRKLKGTINVGGNPRRVAFSATGDMGVVTNLNGYLSFIQ